MQKTYKTARKIFIAIVGFTIIVAGLAMLVLPGPGILVIIAGLAVLAAEFAWAERYLKTLKAKANQVSKKITNKNNKSD